MKPFSDLALPRDAFAVRGRRLALYGIKAKFFDAEVGKLFADATRQCDACGGTGLADEHNWHDCPTCRGFGVVYQVNPTELEFRRLLVKLRHPDALIEGWKPAFG